MRKEFAKEIHKLMEKDKDVFFLTADLGMYVLDDLKKDFPQRFFNVGASEQAMLDIAVGLSLSGKKVITYTITPFYLRAFEGIRTYINHEEYPILMTGSGRDKDYSHDGFSHDASDFKEILSTQKNIKQNYPKDIIEMTNCVQRWYSTSDPTFISLRK